jgi:hypothetical protein
VLQVFYAISILSLIWHRSFRSINAKSLRFRAVTLFTSKFKAGMQSIPYFWELSNLAFFYFCARFYFYGSTAKLDPYVCACVCVSLSLGWFFTFWFRSTMFLLDHHISDVEFADLCNLVFPMELVLYDLGLICTFNTSTYKKDSLSN